MDCIEQGIISRVNGEQAVLIATRSEACSACSSKSACNAMGGSPSLAEVTVNNTLGAQQGDRVVVAMPGSSVVQAAGLLYFFPAAALIAGAVAGNAAANSLALDVNLGALIGAAAALVPSLAIVMLVGRRLSQRQDFTPRVTQILMRQEDLKSTPSDVAGAE